MKMGSGGDAASTNQMITEPKWAIAMGRLCFNGWPVRFLLDNARRRFVRIPVDVYIPGMSTAS